VSGRVPAAVSFASTAVTAVLIFSLAACGGPASVPAVGSVATEVRASLDSGKESFDSSDWGRMLAAGTHSGLVDYGWFAEHRGDLDAFLARVAAARLGALSSPHLEALLINAYNALTIRSILDHPGVASIREIDGVWNKTRHDVGGHDLTLDQIEHNLLRPFFKDPRIHFVVNCASLSCAPLASFAYDGDHLGDQLERAALAFLSDPKQVRVEDGTLYLSSYFKWYGKDFLADGWSPRADTLPGFIARYATPEVAAAIKAAGDGIPVKFLDYDWKLNAAGAGA